MALWAQNAHGDVLPVSMFPRPEEAVTLEAARSALLDGLFADMLGFGACKMIRRIVGFAHVIDFDRIQDAALRASCEARALTMARTLLTSPRQFHSIEDVIDAVPRMVRP
jgi:5-methylthioribose kinase